MRYTLKLFFIICPILGALALLSGCDAVPPILPQTAHPPSATSPVQPGIPSSTPAPRASPSTPVPLASTLDVEADDLRGVLLRFWHPWGGPSAQVIAELVEEFNLDNPYGILVTPVSYSGYDALAEDLTGSPGSDERPQVVAGLLHQALAWNGPLQAIDLNPYVSDPEWGIPGAEQADYFTPFWEQEVVDGRRLGIPAFRSGQLLFYNRTWARELGFQAPPTTPEQFRQQACAAARALRVDNDPANDGAGGWIVSTDYAAMLGWIYAFGGNPLKMPEPGVDQNVYQFNTPEIQEAFTFLRGLFDEGCAWQPQSAVPDTAFAGRLGLFASGSILDIPDQAESFRLRGSHDEWAVLPMPSPDGQPAFNTYGPSYYILSASPEQQLAAWLLIRWLSASENHARLIESSGALPVQKGALESLEGYSQRRPQWSEAVDLLDSARTEPAYASWGQVRFALGDAATQLFRSYFTIDQVPVLLNYLDNFAAELHLGPDLGEIFGTLTYTPTSTATPTRTLTPSPTLTPTRTRTPAPPSSTP
jgi:ABC-type glycerol-3-phosphate transport system substrate-binding protein